MKRKAKRLPVKVPNKFYYGHRLCHVLNHFKDEGEKLFTYKYWPRSKQRWVYVVMSDTEFAGLVTAGQITIKRNLKLYPNTKII